MASKNARGKRRCKNKITYDSKDDQRAKEHIIRFKKQTDALSKYSIYKCKFCNKYHVGHRKKQIIGKEIV